MECKLLSFYRCTYKWYVRYSTLNGMLIEIWTKYNEKSQIGRYQIDNQKKALGINEEGIVYIRIVLYSKVMNDTMNKLSELYGNVDFATKFAR